MWFRELGIRPRVILDIGSYDGGDGVRFKQAFPKCRVLSFEADPIRYEIVKRARAFNVETYELAVTSIDGTIPWYSAKDHLSEGGRIGGQGSLYLQNDTLNEKFSFVEQNKTPASVTGARLSTFCKNQHITSIDLAHIDVQGAEFDVIDGLGSLRPKLLYIEVEQNDGAGWIGANGTPQVHSLLLQCGYKMLGDFISDRLYGLTSAISP